MVASIYYINKYGSCVIRCLILLHLALHKGLGKVPYIICINGGNEGKYNGMSLRLSNTFKLECSKNWMIIIRGGWGSLSISGVIHMHTNLFKHLSTSLVGIVWLVSISLVIQQKFVIGSWLGAWTSYVCSHDLYVHVEVGMAWICTLWKSQNRYPWEFLTFIIIFSNFSIHKDRSIPKPTYMKLNYTFTKKRSYLAFCFLA